MSHIKEGYPLTLKDVKESFSKIREGNLPDLSRFPRGKDGAILFKSWEEYEAAFGGTVSFEETFKW